MIHFIKNITLFGIPWLLLFGSIYFIDPFHLLGSDTFSKAEDKSYVSKKVHDFLWNFSRQVDDPLPNILLGDSRMNAFKPEQIEELTGEKYSSLSSAGCNFTEMIKAFWFAAERQKLKKVYMGMNLSNYNHVDLKNRAEEAQHIIEDKKFYFINRNVLKSAFVLLKDKWTGQETNVQKPKVNSDKFWQFKLKSTANIYYKDYKYPSENLEELKKIVSYCKNNGIDFHFVIFPVHSDLQNIISEKYNRDSEIQKMKADIEQLAITYDFYEINEMTSNRDNFNDPFHFNSEIALELMKKVFN